jgi:type II secretory pathway component PulJ
MRVKMNSRGTTLLELIIAISLLTVVLFSAYFFLTFSTRSMINTEAEFDAGQDARMSFISLEKDIRKAQAVKISGTRHKAVEVLDSGMTLNVYTDVGNDGTLQLVQYKLVNNQLKRGEAELGLSPSLWSTIADKVNNAITSPSTPIFTISSTKVNIELLVVDEKNQLSDNPASIKTSITVRTKGAMN